MSSIDDTDFVPVVDAVSGFGSVEDVHPLHVMRVSWVNDEWVFCEEVPASYMVQAKSFPLDARQSARWLRLTVRVPIGGGITPDDELVLAAFPFSRRWQATARFKSGNRKGKDADSARRSHPAASAIEFATEEKMHEWIETLPHDLWERGDFLTAAVSRPGVEVQARNVAAGRKTFGVVRGTVSDVVQKIFQHSKLKAVSEVARRGRLACAPTKGVKAGLDRDVSLHGGVVDAIDSLMVEAVMRALAGPESTDSEKWIGQPVWRLADQMFRDLVFAENRRHGVRAGREEGNEQIDDFGEDGA